MNPVTGLALGRIAVGAGALADPEKSARIFRLDPVANPQLPYLMRMFGAREVALGVITLVSRGGTRRALSALGMAVDGSDAYAAYDAGRTGAVPTATMNLLLAPAALAVVAGAAGVVRRSNRPATSDD